MKRNSGALLAMLVLPFVIVGSAHAGVTHTTTVAYPNETGSTAKPTVVRVLGQPTNGSCDVLAKKFQLDAASVLIASNRNGEVLCLLDDVS